MKDNIYEKFMSEMTDEKAVEYLYENSFIDLKIADYITKRLKELTAS
jgi:hypothetical protein